MSDSIHSSDYKEQSSHKDTPVQKIHTTGDGDEFVVIGKQKFYKHELMRAFGGTLNPGLSAPPVHKFANPAPLGLCAFSLTTLVLSFYNASAQGVHTANVVVGLAAFYGGAVQFLAGCWELVVGNTFGGTALTSYGAFWLSFAAVNVESFGIAAAYADAPEQLSNGLGLYLLAWGLFTFMLTSLTLKSTLAFFALFFFLGVTFLLLAAGEMTGHSSVSKAGGIFGIITSFIGFYNAWAGVATPTNAYFTAYPIPLSKQ